MERDSSDPISGSLDDRLNLDDKRSRSNSRHNSGSERETEVNSGPINPEPSKSKWLSAHSDPLASLYTLTSCICFIDLNGDGDQKLVIADLGNGIQGMKLNIYKGTFILSQLTLIDCPSGVVSFYMESSEPRIPAIGVASGPYLYIYKHLKPFYKFGLPSLEVNQAELDAWEEVREDRLDANGLREILESLRVEIGESNLTPRSQAYLDLDGNPSESEDFLVKHKGLPLKRHNIITCIATIKKTVDEDNNLNCLIIGTENKDIFIIEPDAFTILASVQLPSIPVFLEISGLFNVEYRLIVSCRDACIYTIKRGFKTGRLCVQLNSQPVGLIRSNNNIIVATMDHELACYTVNGNCVWKVEQPAGITNLAAVEIEILGMSLIAVALESRQILFYNGKVKVDSIETDDVVTAMKFGRYGREDNTLVMVSRSGQLVIQILKRTAKFIPIEPGVASLSLSSSKMNIPKKTKLFVDQSVREREEAVTIHRTFQQDLYRLRLTAARAYVKAITASLNPMSSNPVDPLKLSAQVHGLGPVFRLVLEIQNTLLDQSSTNLSLIFFCDAKIYRIHRNFIPIPYLNPGYIYTFATKVECINELNISDFIKIYVVREHESLPLITAIINMPPSESPI